MGDCRQGSETVCFDQLGCDVSVNTQGRIVSKNGEDVYYEDDGLMLAAIFSDSEIYECQLKRLLKRAGELGAVYSRKAAYLDGSGCSNNLIQDLQAYVLAIDVNGSREFVQQVVPLADDLEERNGNIARCKIF